MLFRYFSFLQNKTFPSLKTLNCIIMGSLEKRDISVLSLLYPIIFIPSFSLILSVITAISMSEFSLTFPFT